MNQPLLNAQGMPIYPGQTGTFQESLRQIKVLNLFLLQVGQYTNQYFRPYQPNVTYASVKELEYELNRTAKFTATGLAQLSNQYIQPSATPGQNVQIINGWNSFRYRFIMRIAFISDMATSEEIITGYTDMDDISQQTQQLNPDMCFFINSIIPLKKIILGNGVNNTTHIAAMQPAHVYSKEHHIDGNLSGIYTLTPESVITQMRVNNFAFDQSEIRNTANEIVYPSTSLMENNNPGRYISKVLNRYQNVTLENNQSIGMLNDNDVLSETMSGLYEPPITKDLFMNTLFNQMHGAFNKAWFSWKDINKVDHYVDQVTTVVRKNHEPVYNKLNNPHLNQMLAPMQDPTGMQHLGGSDYDTQMALNISNVLPSIMMDFGIVHMQFSSTNNRIDGKADTFIGAITTLGGSDVDMSIYRPAIIGRINDELISIISQKGMINYEINVSCDVAGDTFINASYNSAPFTPFLIPSFASSLFDPILTTNKQDISNMVQGFTGMFDMISNAAKTNMKIKSVEFDNRNWGGDGTTPVVSDISSIDI